MKPYQITLFLFLVILALAVVSALFPEKGVDLGKVHLRFPGLEQVMVRDTPANEWVDPLAAIQDSLKQIAERERKTEKDTLDYYVKMIEMNPAAFCLPGDDKTFFDAFFKMLEEEGDSVPRILHYGDSQIEMDRITSQLRAFFQGKFGGGGPGLIPLRQTVASASVYQSVSGMLSDYAVYGTAARSKDRFYGPLFRYARIGGSVQLTVSAPKHKQLDPNLLDYEKITVLAKERSGGLRLHLKGKGIPAMERTIDSAGIHLLAFPLDTPLSRFTLSLDGNADIYGILVDHRRGVAVDNIPIRGSSGTFFTGVEDSLLAEMYQEMRVGMIILQFGGNSVPGISGTKGIEYLKNTIAEQIRFLRRCCPAATLLFIGPSDMSTRVNGSLQTYPYLALFNDALKEAALENGAAYWDMFSIMGGENSMIGWVNHGLAGNDYIHFTPKGASRIGEALQESFSLMYDFYTMRKNFKHPHSMTDSTHTLLP